MVSDILVKKPHGSAFRSVPPTGQINIATVNKRASIVDTHNQTSQ